MWEILMYRDQHIVFFCFYVTHTHTNLGTSLLQRITVLNISNLNQVNQLKYVYKTIKNKFHSLNHE
jgi:hypothetical protein